MYIVKRKVKKYKNGKVADKNEVTRDDKEWRLVSDRVDLEAVQHVIHNKSFKSGLPT